MGAFEAGDCSITVGKMRSMLDAFRKDWPPGADWPAIDPIPVPGPRVPEKNIPGIVGDTVAGA